MLAQTNCPEMLQSFKSRGIRAATLVVFLGISLMMAQADEPKVKPKFKPSKETTYVLGPIDKDGYIDYETALNEMMRGKITPETNAVVVLMKCIGPKPGGKALHPDFYKWLGTEPPSEKGDYLIPSHDFLRKEKRQAQASKFDEREDQIRNRPWKASDSPLHAQWLKRNDVPLSLAREASLRKDYFHPLISRTADGKPGLLIGASQLSLQSGREIARQLSLRAMLKLGEGNVEAALDDALTIHRLGRLVAHGGFLIEWLVGIAIDSIAHQTDLAIFEHGKLSAKQALAYQAELQRLPRMESVVDKISKHERLFFLDSVQNMARGTLNPMMLASQVPNSEKMSEAELKNLQKAVDFERIMQIGNAGYDKIEQALRKQTRAERVEASKALEEEFERLGGDPKAMEEELKALAKESDPAKLREQISTRIGATLLKLLLPAFKAVMYAYERSEQQNHNGLIAAGLAAYFADNKSYPEKLEDLVPKYIEKLPIDYFSGKPLKYKKTDSGYLFYSIGQNGVDDGGKLIIEKPPGDDIGVRIPRK